MIRVDFSDPALGRMLGRIKVAVDSGDFNPAFMCVQCGGLYSPAIDPWEYRDERCFGCHRRQSLRAESFAREHAGNPDMAEVIRYNRGPL